MPLSWVRFLNIVGTKWCSISVKIHTMLCNAAIIFIISPLYGRLPVCHMIKTKNAHWVDNPAPNTYLWHFSISSVRRKCKCTTTFGLHPCNTPNNECKIPLTTLNITRYRKICPNPWANFSDLSIFTSPGFQELWSFQKLLVVLQCFWSTIYFRDCCAVGNSCLFLPNFLSPHLLSHKFQTVCLLQCSAYFSLQRLFWCPFLDHNRFYMSQIYLFAICFYICT